MSSDLSKCIEEQSIKGFLSSAEGDALYRYAISAAELGPCLEIGSYCGKSTVYLGSACRQSDRTLYAVDHHRGSEEHQPGESYHDRELYNAELAEMDSFPVFRRTLDVFELSSHVVPIVSASEHVLRDWATPLAMVFIDGGHSPEAARRDCLGWSSHLISSGILAIHDIFPHPDQGGQGPYLAMQAVLQRGEFRILEQVESLAFLQRA